MDAQRRIYKIDYRHSDYVNEKLTDEEYFARLDKYTVFHPSDTQIVEFLMKKIKNEKLPRNLIKVVNIYEIDPEKLADNYGKLSTEIWYFFTLRDRKYQNENINVSTVDGYWQVKGNDKNVEYNGETVGFLKIFQFYMGKPGNGKKTSWVMHEFRATDPLPPPYTVEGRTKQIQFASRLGKLHIDLREGLLQLDWQAFDRHSRFLPILHCHVLVPRSSTQACTWLYSGLVNSIQLFRAAINFLLNDLVF